MLALGRFRESAAGDIAPRQVLVLVEWESGAPSRAIARIPRWPTCTRTGKQAPQGTCGTCSTGSMTYGRSFAYDRTE